MDYDDGWYKIPHLPPKVEGMKISGNDDQWGWTPRRTWLRKTLGPEFERWYMSGPVYTYSEGPTGPDKKDMETIIPLSWCFKSEQDAMMFVLRWGR